MVTEVPMLLAEGITKSFPGVRALDNVSFDARRGEIHALLGENGAGKSTLVKILSGSLAKDAGRIFLDGTQVEVNSPTRARNLGIGMVYQELSLIPTLSVAENICLGRWPRRRFGRVDWGATYAVARAELEKLGLDVNLKARVGSLSVAEQQLVEIAKVTSQNVRILLLDEPTSALSDNERERLFRLVKGLRDKGITIIYISHRLAEVMEIADRITILRDGKKVGTFHAGNIGHDELVSMMIGRSMKDQFPAIDTPGGEPVLQVEGITVQGLLHDISFCVGRGEIVGIFGLMGSGRTTLARVLFGLQRAERGAIMVDGVKVDVTSPGDAIRAGIGYLTEDRRQGLVPFMAIPPNVTLSSLRSISSYFVLDRKREDRLAQRFIEDLRIRTPSLRQKVSRLSGGNQQKVVLSKWLCSKSKILVFDEPTRGIDVGAKAEVFQLMARLAREGIAIVMLSSELPELLGMCNRILVMRKGRIVAQFEACRTTQEELLKSASGIGV
ncbi:MAG TPA: sugar ABC transporter ATP-binding protein [Firmicutes bacterium]|nr:sugar ABC transporter ATP-binding protein [Bacillota bacterium]